MKTTLTHVAQFLTRAVADTRIGKQRVLGCLWLPVQEAALCLDCEAVFRLRDPACPACGSTTSMTLTAWLDRRKHPA